MLFVNTSNKMSKYELLELAGRVACAKSSIDRATADRVRHLDPPFADLLVAHADSLDRLIDYARERIEDK